MNNLSVEDSTMEALRIRRNYMFHWNTLVTMTFILFESRIIYLAKAALWKLYEAEGITCSIGIP